MTEKEYHAKAIQLHQARLATLESENEKRCGTPEIVTETQRDFHVPNIIKLDDFPANQYVSGEETNKVGVVLHHSAGWDDARKMYRIWANDKLGRVSTAFGVTDNGEIIQGFDGVKHWGFAIYVNSKSNKIDSKYKTRSHQYFLERRYIQLEICNWGWLKKKGDKFYSWANVEVPADKVQVYEKGYRGAKYFEKYTDAEVEAVRNLLLWLNRTYQIPVQYNPDMFDISEKALNGGDGVWAHTSFRTDKSDIHPQPNLIDALKEVHQIVYGK